MVFRALGEKLWLASLLAAAILSVGCSRSDSALDGSTEVAKTEKRTPTAHEISDFVKDCVDDGTVTEAACRCAAEQILADHSQEELNRAQMGSAYEKTKAIFAYLRQVRPITQACDGKFPRAGGSRLASAIAAQDQKEQEFFRIQLSMAPTFARDLCSRVYEDNIKLCGTKVIDCAIDKARAQHSDVAVTDFFDGVSHTDQFKDFFGGFLQQCLAEQPSPALSSSPFMEEANAMPSTSDSDQSYPSDEQVNDNQPNG